MSYQSYNHIITEIYPKVNLLTFFIHTYIYCNLNYDWTKLFVLDAVYIEVEMSS
jgi:hypothetical protein